jgi:rare lipoprotein A
MNQRLWNGLTAVMLTTALSATSCHAQQKDAVVHRSEASHSLSAVGGGEKNPSKSRQTDPQWLPIDGKNRGALLSNQTQLKLPSNTPLPSPASTTQPVEAVKVGEFQSQSQMLSAQEAIAKIETHQVAGRPAATLYVRNIPVLTFIGAAASRGAQTPPDTKLGQAGVNPNQTLASTPAIAPSGATNSQTDPVWRAMAVAARLNQLSRNNLNANKIAVRWSGNTNAAALGQPSANNGQRASDRYVIQIEGQDLVEINGETRLPDTTRNLAQDALQATNRLRRLLGNAPPIREIAGRPAPVRPQQPVSLVTVLSSFRGWASWYGPGFHGNRSASGEIYNQNQLTAAHRSLPFGTQVRVTNLNNNTSVIVRINDRGPFVRGRIIDLSTAAARVLGMMGSGVAPVRLEVLGKPQLVTLDEK